MTTPNIEELIDRLYDWHNTSAEQNRLDMQKAADLLQSQAERLKELEQSLQTGPEIIAGLFARAANMEKERDTLRAELAEIVATEPVAWKNDFSVITTEQKDGNEFQFSDEFLAGHTVPLFTRPMPAQDVTELVEALEKLARLGNGEHYGNSDGNMIAHDALSKYKGAKQ